MWELSEPSFDVIAVSLCNSPRLSERTRKIIVELRLTF